MCAVAVPVRMVDAPVRMFWKASSTLLASRAEVSIKDRWFSPARGFRSVGLIPERAL